MTPPTRREAVRNESVCLLDRLNRRQPHPLLV